MHTTKCPHCNEDVSNAAGRCYRCGNNLVPEPARSDADSVRMQRMGMPGSRAHERAVREAVAATQPLMNQICYTMNLYGTPRVLIDAAGVVTVETVLPPEIKESVDRMVEAVQGIRDSIFKAALGHTTHIYDKKPCAYTEKPDAIHNP